jgi:hypothetical protein
MKKALLVVVQFLVFFMVFLAGSLLDPFKMRWFVSHPSPEATRFFVPDGLILMVLLYIVILAAEVARRRLRGPGVLTSVAFVVALALGLLSKFGWATHDLF